MITDLKRPDKRKKLKKLMWSIADQHRKSSRSPLDLQLITLGTLWMAYHYNQRTGFRLWIESQSGRTISDAINFLLQEDNNVSLITRKYLHQAMSHVANVSMLEVLHVASELKEVAYAFQDVMEMVRGLMLSDTNMKDMRGYYSASPQMRMFLSGIIEIKDGDRVLDPASGLGYALSNLDIVRAKSVELCDINPAACVLANLLWNIRDNATEVNVQIIDSLTHVQDWANSVDVLICEPPIGKSDLKFAPGNPLFAKSNDFTELFIWYAIEVLSEKGRGFIVVPDAILYSQRSKKLRQELLKRDIIEAIIALPAGLYAPYTQINTNLLILNKSKSPVLKGKIRIFDLPMLSHDGSEKETIDLKKFTRQYQSALHGDSENELQLSSEIYLVAEDSSNYLSSVSDQMTTWFNTISCHSDIAEENVLVPSRYLGATRKELETQLRKGDRLIPLGQLLTRLHLLKLSNHGELSKPSLITPGSFPYTQFDPLEPNALPERISTNRIAVLSEKALLITPGAGGSKAAYFKGTETAGLSTRISAWKFDESLLLPDYFISEFRQEYIQNQMRKFLYGGAVRGIRDTDFGKLLFRLPDISRQLEYIKIEKEKVLTLKNEEVRALKKKLQIEDRGFEILTNFKHDFMGDLDNLSSGFKLLKGFLQDKADTKEHVSMQESIVPGMIEERWIIKNWLEKFGQSIDSAVNKLDDEVENMKFDMEPFEPVELEVEKLISELVEVHKSATDCTFIVEKSIGVDEEIFVMIDVRMMTSLVDNLVRNAIKHGFKGSDRINQIIFRIGLKTVRNEEFVTIDYMNNGRPFASGFTFEDFVQRGRKAGDSRGSGIGGDRINRIVQKHGGIFREYKYEEEDLDVLDAGKKVYPIHFEILLPLEN